MTAEPVRFEATANVDDTVNESHEGNNVVRLNFAGGHLPDLVIESVIYSPAEPLFDQLLMVTATVATSGSGRAGVSHTVVSLGAVGSSFIYGPGLIPGERSSSTFEVKAKGPTETIQVEADAYGEVVEVDETNTMTFIGSAPSGIRTVLVVVDGFPSYSNPKRRTTMSPTRSATRPLGVSLRVSEGLKANLSVRR